MVYGFLALAVAMALFLSERPRAIGRWGLALAGTALLIPNLAGPWWFTRIAAPPFFSTEMYRDHLSEGETVMILPYGGGDCMWWQVKSRMYFTMAEGYFGLPASEFLSWPIFAKLYNPAIELLETDLQLKGFLGAHHVSTIIATPAAASTWRTFFAAIDPHPQSIGGVVLFRVPASIRAEYANTSPGLLRHRIDAKYFPLLLRAADRYVKTGLPVSRLNPWEAQRLHLVTLPDSGSGETTEDPTRWSNFWLGPMGPNPDVGIGIFGDYEDFGTIVHDYKRFAIQILFPYPQPIGGDPSVDAEGQLLMIFSPDGLDRAAQFSANVR
jgi:hypothetical protein